MSKNTSVAPVATPAPAVVPAPSKMSQCKAIFDSMPGARRTDVIKEMMAKIGISKTHAGTYYQTIFSKNKSVAVAVVIEENAAPTVATTEDLETELAAAVNA